MISILLGITLMAAGSDAKTYKCGQDTSVTRPYGIVRLQVACGDEYDSSDKNITVLEFKGKKQHGISLHLDSLWRKHDSSFFVNGKHHGALVFWDTLGNEIARRGYHNGVQVGKDESYWAPGRPSLIRNYNANGEVDGPWQKWWPNGNKRGDYVSKHDQVISATEYYQDGKPRIKFVGSYEARKISSLKQKYIQCESWAPNGKPAGKVVNGNGKWIIFPDGGEPAAKMVVREVYKDSVIADLDTLTASETAKWTAP